MAEAPIFTPTKPIIRLLWHMKPYKALVKDKTQIQSPYKAHRTVQEKSVQVLNVSQESKDWVADPANRP